MIPAEWKTHELSHKYSGANLYFVHVIEGHPNYVRLAEFDSDDKIRKVWTAHKDMVKVHQVKINDVVKEFPMSKQEKQQVAELRDRIAKGEDCIHNGFVVAKGGNA